MRFQVTALLSFFGIAILVPQQAYANGGVCPRPAMGSIVAAPPDIFSQNGALDVSLSYYTSLDDAGRTLFCFVTPDGKETPTLHVRPGDSVTIHLTNQIAAAPLAPSELVASTTAQCGSGTMTDSSVNMHFHGLNIAPKCHSDETIFTLVNSGETFDYSLKIPADEPPGLYWYHPHVHGISSQAVQGGATGLIEVEGIENLQPAVAGLPERYLIIRDEPLASGLNVSHPEPAPFWDISLNDVTVQYPRYTPAVLEMHAGTQEFWRVANAAANTITDLQVKYDGVAQPLQIVAFDGVPTGSQDGKRQGTIVTQTNILVPPAGRVEFIIKGPSKKVKSAIFETETIDGGPASDSNPRRPLAAIQLTQDPNWLPRAAERSGPPNAQRFERLQDAVITARRTLYFLEIPSKLSGDRTSQENDVVPGPDKVKFYITVDGQFNQLFYPDEPPAITTTRGAVEEWTIQNRTPEVHEFHIHQVHFLVEEVSGTKIPADKQQFYDTYQVGWYKGKGRYPYIKVRMDFRGAVVGDFVYHCHILDHEDGGMMAKIRVLSKT